MLETDNQFDIRLWWKKLDIIWKNIFKRTLDINHSPDEEELKEIFSIEDIDCSSTHIISLEPLQYLKKLRKLNCSNTEIVSLSKISDLILIDELDVSGTKVKSLTPISNFSRLWVLKCHHTAIENLLGLEGCTSLEYLYCSSTIVSDFEPLSKLANLKYLDCRYTKLLNAEPLKHLSEVLYDGTPFEEKVSNLIDLKYKDELFDDAARIVVMNQTGSTSAIQRKFSIGYYRAGRIMDQLEAAGIVGMNEGSTARAVLIHDEINLERLLKSLGNGDFDKESVIEQSILTESILDSRDISFPETMQVKQDDSNHRLLKIISIILIVIIVFFAYLIIIRL